MIQDLIHFLVDEQSGLGIFVPSVPVRAVA
jgi:hypothetical protein